MASNADLQIFQGDDYNGLVTVSKTGVPPSQALQGYTAQSQIRNGFADDQSTVVVTIGTQINSPYIILSIPHSDTTRLQSDSLRWDLQVTDPNGLVTTLVAGLVRLQREVTR